MKLLLICLHFLLAADVVYSQRQTIDVLNDLYGEITADSVFIDLKKQHVKEIRKIMNEGAHVTTVHFDKEGRYTYFLYKEGFTVDSIVYDSKGRMVRYLILANGTIDGFREYIYKDDLLAEEYWTNNKGNKQLQNRYRFIKSKDTGIVVNTGYNTLTTTKRYDYKGVEYTLITSTEADKKTEERLFYIIADANTKTTPGRIIELGEIEYAKGIMDTILIMAENGLLNVSPDDEDMMTMFYTLENSQDMHFQRKIVEKRFPQLKGYIGKRVPDMHYNYDQVTGRVIAYTKFPAESFQVQYNDMRRIISIIPLPENTGVTTKYIYEKNGLPAKITKGEEDNEAVFEYEYYR